MDNSPLALITGASTGIGYELAKCCAKDGYHLIVCADEEEIHAAAEKLKQLGVPVEAVQADLSTVEGVESLCAAVGDRTVDALLANAGKGLGDAFLNQNFSEVKNIIDLNITGTLYLVQTIGRKMRDRNAGKILITGSVAGLIPGAFQAAYNGTKAFLNSFSDALRNELKHTSITVTCLLPGPTETQFFDRAKMKNTHVGQTEKDDPAMVARAGYDAMQKGEAAVASGFMNKVQSTLAGIIPDKLLAQMHRKMAQPEKDAVD